MKPWPTVKLKFVTSKVGSGATPRGGEAVYKQSGVPLIRSMNIHFDGFRRDGLVYLDDKEASLLDGVKVQSNDVLFNITGASIGRVTTAPAEMAGARVNQHVCIIRPSDELIPRFLSYYLCSREQQALVGSNQIGGTRKAVTKGMLLNWEIPLPPLEEQERIVGLLDEADELRNLRAKANRRASFLIPALFNEMFGDLENNPKRWPRGPLRSFNAEVRYGLGQPPELDSDGVPMLRATNIKHGLISKHGLIRIRRDAVPKSRNAFLNADDVLVVRSGAYTGDAARVGEQWVGSVAGYDLVVSPNERFTGEFVAWFLLSRFVQGQYFQGLKSRAAQPHLNSEQVSETPFFCPPLPLQAEFARLVIGIREMEAEQTGSGRRLEDLFQSLLHRAFRGES